MARRITTSMTATFLVEVTVGDNASEEEVKAAVFEACPKYPEVKAGTHFDPDDYIVLNDETVPSRTCRHCGRSVMQDDEGRWVDPAATGDDSVWRETCDAHDTFVAEHEPTDEEG